jgi:hypothetical protein
VSLNIATRDGETELFILTNLPKSVADALLIAEMYRKVTVQPPLRDCPKKVRDKLRGC